MAESFWIDLTNQHGLLSVWELGGNDWKLVTLARPRQAKALCANQRNRLVFPSQINPNYINKLVSFSGCNSEGIAQIDYRIKILELLQACPGQSANSMAEQLNIKVESLRRHLRQLTSNHKIHYHFCSAYKKTRLYYPGPELGSPS